MGSEKLRSAHRALARLQLSQNHIQHIRAPSFVSCAAALYGFHEVKLCHVLVLLTEHVAVPCLSTLGWSHLNCEP